MYSFLSGNILKDIDTLDDSISILMLHKLLYSLLLPSFVWLQTLLNKMKIEMNWSDGSRARIKTFFSMFTLPKHKLV